MLYLYLVIMSPDFSTPSFELPAPKANEGEGPIPQEQAPLPRPEAKPAPSQQPPRTSAPIDPNPAPIPSTATQPAIMPVDQPAPQTMWPQVAEDNDLIEKEWVVKAKQIVAATREDPHTQNKEINRFKADYLKKRYNKDIKLEES